MMRVAAVFLLFLLISVAGGWFMLLQKTEASVKEGDLVPDLSFPADDGTVVRTGDLRGKWVVLYFYPKDDTPGCTTEAKRFSALLEDFKKAGAMVYGVNNDSGESHRRFKEKYLLRVTLLTDQNNLASDSFGITKVAGLCSRDSVLIDPEGRVEKIYRGVDPSASPVEILTYIFSKNEG
jgi:peroxiredoxin Q/BCP